MNTTTTFQPPGLVWRRTDSRTLLQTSPLEEMQHAVKHDQLILPTERERVDVLHPRLNTSIRSPRARAEFLNPRQRYVEGIDLHPVRGEAKGISSIPTAHVQSTAPGGRTPASSTTSSEAEPKVSTSGSWYDASQNGRSLVIQKFSAPFRRALA